MNKANVVVSSKTIFELNPSVKITERVQPRPLTAQRLRLEFSFEMMERISAAA